MHYSYVFVTFPMHLSLFPSFLSRCFNTCEIVICILQKTWQFLCSSSFLVLLKNIASLTVKFNVCNKLNHIFPGLWATLLNCVPSYILQTTEYRNRGKICVSPCLELGTSTHHFCGRNTFSSCFNSCCYSFWSRLCISHYCKMNSLM